MEDSLISISEILRSFKKRLWIIILITLITTIFGFSRTRGLVPSYSGYMKVLISTSEKEMDYYSPEQIEYYSNFSNIFLEIIRAGDYLEKPLKKNDVKTSYEVVKNGIGIAPGANVPIFTISYSGGNEDDIEKIINTIYHCLMNELKEVQPNVKSKVVSDINVNTIYPNKKKFIVLGFAVGLIFSSGIVMVLIYLDGSVKNRKQLEKITGLPILGMIPKHEREFEKEERKNVYSG
ncbi:MAG: Wzz/FepE/Etk N-terminal domain-containing protein [Terrisporobacter sp.]|uniref:YveK family protein n=1 Tax=Terrisporobacter sp. TaxID=1965305 RepID=UPI002A9183C8|nr:Wzz/FepE/Etk N-terminal domain-containing protein [Terrisporobacter sp.]MDY6153133.1 Wzz/FepE/Etk N-terminal domain-containing protein [Terrisporobacter sp.]